MRAIVTGSGGLVGSESARLLVAEGYEVLGIDNDMRSEFFGAEASTADTTAALEADLDGFTADHADIRATGLMDRAFRFWRPAIVVHAAAQPSHDWAAREVRTDFGINACGTLNLLEATRRHAPDATFVTISTSKVYGDTPNRLPLEEHDSRLDLPADHEFRDGVTTAMSVDQSTHSLFGVSKLAGDLLTQEYGRYFGMPTCCLRLGCITGPAHRGAELHGFLAYLVRCAVEGRPYMIYGYRGKQVRCNLSGADLARACLAFHEDPRPGAVYNLGGGRESSCSVLEAIELVQDRAGELDVAYDPEPRIGDHRWWISDTAAFRADYPTWGPRDTLPGLVEQMLERTAAWT
jgi:CDP-paratose 2-epimerase